MLALSLESRIVRHLHDYPRSTAREIAHALGFVDGRDVAHDLKILRQTGVVASAPEKLDRNGLPVRTRYWLTEGS